MASHRDFYREVHNRAWAAARRAMHLDERTSMVIAVLLFLIYALLVWHFVGAADATTEIEERILATALPVIGACFVYFGHRRHAASDIHAEADEEHSKQLSQMKAENRFLEDKLSELADDRPLTFKTINVNFVDAPGALYQMDRISLVFSNKSEKMIEWRVTSPSITIDNIVVPILTGALKTGSSFVAAGEDTSAFFQFGFRRGVTAQFSVTVEFTLIYDNKPPVRVRTSYRKVRYDFTSIVPMQWTAMTLDERED